MGSVCQVTSRRVGESLASCGDCGPGEGLSGSVALDTGEEPAGRAALIFGEGLFGSAASAACAKAWLGAHKQQAGKITIMKNCLNTDFIDSFGCASLVAGKSEKLSYSASFWAYVRQLFAKNKGHPHWMRAPFLWSAAKDCCPCAKASFRRQGNDPAFISAGLEVAPNLILTAASFLRWSPAYS